MANGSVVSVLNMKGGVGKTTISAHVMRVLYHKMKKKVLLVDLDPQFNLTQALVTRSEYDTLKDANRTILVGMEPVESKSLFEIKTSNNPPPAARKIADPLRGFSDGSAYLDLVAGNFDLVKYSLISDLSKLDKVKNRFRRFISGAKKDYDLVVIDCNPSSSFITTCALDVADYLLVPVRADRYSMLGLELLADLLDRLPNIAPKPEMLVVFNGIGPSGHVMSQIEKEIRANESFGPNTLSNGVPQSNLFVASSGYTGFATDKPVPYRKLLDLKLKPLVEEISDRIGL